MPSKKKFFDTKAFACSVAGGVASPPRTKIGPLSSLEELPSHSEDGGDNAWRGGTGGAFRRAKVLNVGRTR